MLKKYGKFRIALLCLSILYCLNVGGCQRNISKQEEGASSVGQSIDNEMESQEESHEEGHEDNQEENLKTNKESNPGVNQPSLAVPSQAIDSNLSEKQIETADSSQEEKQSELREESQAQEREEELTQQKETEKVIVIDAGHQAKGNAEKESIGPGAKDSKAKVSSGTQGIKTKVPEYKVNLSISLKLEKLLTDMGYKVIMIRTTDDVNIPNSERAAIANENNADVFVRIHCNGSENHSISGALTMCQTKDNPYCGADLYQYSRDLSESILLEMCEATGAKNQGIMETDTMSGINWCKVPVTIVEMGYMTNEKEDELLVTDQYQEQLAQGIANGIQKYFENQQ